MENSDSKGIIMCTSREKSEEWVLSQIHEKYKNGKFSDLTIWVGAGVSSSGPTCLPMGNQLNEFLLSNYYLNSNKIAHHWQKINKMIEELSQWDLTHSLSYPRLELIIECAMYTERYLFPDNKFICGFESFDLVSPNTAHECLAMLYYYGVKIMTANFDVAIEKAYQNKYRDEMGYVKGRHSCAVIAKDRNRNEIIHFHGTSLSGFYMGGTLTNMINSLDSNILKKIKTCFQRGKINLFLGYSLSDVYDINEVLLEMKDSKNQAINIVCNHQGYDKYLGQKVNYLFGEHGYIFDADTTGFLVKIIKECLVKNLDNKKSHIIKWQDNFEKKTECSYEYKLFTTLYLLTQLKIQPELILPDFLDDYIRIRQKVNSPKASIWDLHILDMSKCIDPQRYDKYYLVEKTLKNMNTKIHSTEQADELEEKLIDIRDIYGRIKEKQFITYEESIPISHYMKIVIYKIMKGEELGQLRDIEKIIDLVIDLNYKKSISLVVYASCLRYKIVFRALKFEKDDELFRRAFNLYYDFGNLDGVISCLIYKAISEFILEKKEPGSNLLIIKAREMAELNRRKKYLDQIDFLCNL